MFSVPPYSGLVLAVVLPVSGPPQAASTRRRRAESAETRKTPFDVLCGERKPVNWRTMNNPPNKSIYIRAYMREG
jgi:hypothetical protein